jgi:predicted phage terminase large subunit-like protein
MTITADTIAGFSASLLQKGFDGAVESPPCHYEWWTYCCSSDPLVAIAAPRGHAKSTAITFSYTLACMVFRERSYAIIVSDTVAQSTQFLADIKRELSENQQLRSLFKIADIDKWPKETEDDMIVLCTDGHMFRLQAKGSEQKVRGLKWNNKRPDLIICDDLENDEIVLNKERREKFRRWFNGALLPARSARGIVRYVGTILHNDSLLERFMPKLHDKATVDTPLKVYRHPSAKKTSWKSVKYRAHNPDFSEILWPQNWSKEKLLATRESLAVQGLADLYSQEYLNNPIDESVAYFKRPDLLAMSKEDHEKHMLYYITADLAISKESYADYSVFLIAGVDENRTIHVLDVIRERLDGREIVDLILDLEKVYQAEVLGIEKMQVSQAIGPFLREEMVARGIFPSLMQLEHGGKDKISRAKSMQGRVRAHTVKFDKSRDWYPEFEDEICSFPRGKHDDQLDAFAWLGMLLDRVLEAPTQQELADEEYYDGFARNNEPRGRSRYTGY